MKLYKLNTALRTLCMAGLILPASVPAYAGNNPLTGKRDVGGKTVFDIVISLQDEKPAGDDDATVDAGPSDDAQNAYERRIQSFADAVYEMTNGQHQLGRVTIFKNDNKQKQADIKWYQTCASDAGPAANVSKFNRAGGDIRMCSNWDGALSDAEVGATLAHEWGHYAYGLYDEYQAAQCTITPLNNCAGRPTATDVAVAPSIMNCQWFATGGACTATNTTTYTGARSDFYEFSTPNLDPYLATSTGSTAHKRIFNESGWSTLSRDSKTDPQWKSMYGAKRVYYSDLSSPASPYKIVKNANTTQARSELKIKWAGDPVVNLMIDRSGSMNGTPIANAKTAATILVDQLNAGSTAIGVGSFASSASQNYPVTQIPNPDTGVKTAAKAAISGLSAGGGTNIDGGLATALSATQTFDASRSALVYLLSDGVGGTSNRNTTIANYNAAGATIISFAYGSSADETALRAYADGTGGAFFQSPTTLADIQSAFATANALYSSTVSLASGSKAVAPAATDARPIQVDSTLDSLNVSVSYTGSAANVTLALVRANGSTHPTPFTCTGSTQQTCNLSLDSAAIAAGGVGSYSLRVTNNSGAPIDVLSLVSAQPKANAQTYTVDVEFEDAAYPAPMLVRATVSGEYPLSGVTLVATLSDPNGKTSTVALRDDGKGADNIADDGTYSGSIHYTKSGNYNVTVEASNPNGAAQTTFQGMSFAVGRNGAFSNPTPSSVPQNFTRFASATSQATGVKADDHADAVTSPGSCTAIQPDNSVTNGRIDRAGDVDCFTFVPSSTSSGVTVRATGLASGMSPVVRIFDATGATQLATFNVASSTLANNGAVFNVPAASLNAAGHVVSVEHTDATAVLGSYQVSVGPAQASDTANVAPTPTPTPPTPTPPTPPSGGGSGGSMDLMSLLILLLLAGGGVHVHRRRKAA